VRKYAVAKKPRAAASAGKAQAAKRRVRSFFRACRKRLKRTQTPPFDIEAQFKAMKREIKADPNVAYAFVIELFTAVVNDHRSEGDDLVNYAGDWFRGTF
jgi:hypothetical protein